MLEEIQGTVMRWFDKTERAEVWEETTEQPIGDIQAAHKIREICRSALDSAERVGGVANRPGNHKSAQDSERYESAAKAAMQIAIKIADDLMRDSAVRQIVNLCMKANDLKTARILFRAIQAVSMREDVLNDHPALRQ
jgi:hypothetical protein